MIYKFMTIKFDLISHFEIFYKFPEVHLMLYMLRKL